MAETPASKVQNRTSSLLSLPRHDGTYMNAAAILTAAGLPADGCPAGMNWRQVAKLSDVELIAALPAPTTITATVKTTAEVRSEIRADRRERRHEFNERTLAAFAPREDQEYLDNLQPQTLRVNSAIDADRNG